MKKQVLLVDADEQFRTKLELVIAEGYGKGLYKDVCKEYIDALNRELIQVKDNLKRELFNVA